MTARDEVNAALTQILQRHSRGSDLVRGELARLIDRAAADAARAAAHTVLEAVEAVADDFGHPPGCDCGDEIDRFVRDAAAAAQLFGSPRH